MLLALEGGLAYKDKCGVPYVASISYVQKKITKRKEIAVLQYLIMEGYLCFWNPLSQSLVKYIIVVVNYIIYDFEMFSRKKKHRYL